MGFDEGGKAALSISCSLCRKDITKSGDRSFAVLICHHEFHLDCIGSFFNSIGVMQCPRCGKIEKGQWLYADGKRPFARLNVHDLFNLEDVYDLHYPKSSVWGPFGEFFYNAGAVAIDSKVDHLPWPTRPNVDHSFPAGQSSSTRGPSSLSSVTNHPHLDSSARRSNTHGGYYPSSSRSFHDADNSMLHRYPHETGPFHQTGSGSARQRHG